MLQKTPPKNKIRLQRPVLKHIYPSAQHQSANAVQKRRHDWCQVRGFHSVERRRLSQPARSMNNGHVFAGQLARFTLRDHMIALQIFGYAAQNSAHQNAHVCSLQPSVTALFLSSHRILATSSVGGGGQLSGSVSLKQQQVTNRPRISVHHMISFGSELSFPHSLASRTFPDTTSHQSVCLFLLNFSCFVYSPKEPILMWIFTSSLKKK